MLTRSEWRWLFIFSLLLTALTCLPTLYAQWAAPAGSTFVGFLINAQDGNSYLAKMRQGYEGAWLFSLPYTPEDQQGIFVFTLYLGLGHLAHLTQVPLLLVFHLARALFTFLFFVTSYYFTAHFTLSLSARRWAFGIVAFGSGLALLSLLVGRSDPKNFVPLDLFVPELSGFYTTLANPHFPLSFALQMWSVLWVVYPPPLKESWRWLGVAALAVALALVSPFLIPFTGVVLVAGFLATRPWDKFLVARVLLYGLVSGGFILYDYIVMSTNPLIAMWAKQNITLTPPLVDVLLGVGIWLPLAIIGLTRVPRTGDGWMLIAWIVVIALMIYFPYSLQRRFISGLFMPLSIFAGIGVSWLMGQLVSRRSVRLAFLLGVLLLGFSTNLLLLASFTRAPATAELYLQNDEVQALQWLAARVQSTDVVLAEPRLGNLIPAWMTARVIYGHPMESVDAVQRQAEVEAFFKNNDQSILDRYRVTYILGGRAPQGWQTVFQSGEVKIYAR